MSRGRKPSLENFSLTWNELFKKNIGAYLQNIIVELGQIRDNDGEKSEDLLNTIRAYNIQRKNAKTYQPIKPEEIPFEIPKNWVWCRLGEIIELADNLNIEAKLSKDTLINYVDIDAIDNKNYLIRESKLKPVSELSSRARRVLKKGFVVYSLVRPYLNNVAIIEDDKPNHIGSTGFSVFNGIFVENRFLKYFLLTDYVRNLYLKMISGFNSPSITHEQFASTLVPLPPVSEQNKILDFLINLDNNTIKENGYYFNHGVEQKILNIHHSQLKTLELNSELNHQLHLVKKLRQQLLQDAIQGKLVPQNPDDEPASVLLQKIKTEKQQLIKEKKLKKEKELPPIKPEEIPFEIPENWVWCRLGEICIKIGSGSTPSGSDYSTEGLPFFRSQNIHDAGLVYDDIKFISPKVHKKMNGTTVYRNDILLNITGGSLGRAAMVPVEFNEGNVSQHVCIVRTIEVDYSYLHKLILSPFFQQMIFSSTTGAGREGLPKYNLEQFIIPLPPFPEQVRIFQKIEVLEQHISELEASIKQSQQQNEQLLQQVLREALTGNRL